MVHFFTPEDSRKVLIKQSFGIVLETHTKVCMTRPYFIVKFFLPKKRGKWAKYGKRKIGFLEFIEKFGDSISFEKVSFNLFYSEILHYLLYSYTNSVSGKNLVPEIFAKMLLANQIAGFLNQLYL